MNIAYKRLGNGEWFVEAWIYTSDMEMVYSSCINKDRRMASWTAFSALTCRFPLTWPLNW